MKKSFKVTSKPRPLGIVAIKPLPDEERKESVPSHDSTCHQMGRHSLTQNINAMTAWSLVSYKIYLTIVLIYT